LKTSERQLPAKNRSSSFVLLASILTVAILPGACTRSAGNNEPASSSGPTGASYPIPPLSAYAQMGWIDANNKRSRLLEYRGKVLVLDFYATWCEPCRQSIPRLNGLQKQYGSKGVQVVGLNVGGPDDRIKVNEFAKELDIQYPLGFPDRALTDVFLADDQTIPQTFIFAREGELIKRFIGYEGDTSAEIERTIQVQLGK
jgi:thiol-disulfide isomerase/thioredoxin